MKDTKILVKNRKAYFNYLLEQEFTAGIQLLGSEVKNIRLGNFEIGDSFVDVRGNECFLVQSKVPSIDRYGFFSHEVNRERKLLLRKSEIRKIFLSIKKKGYTCIPVSVFLVGGLIKIRIALARGKKLWDKRNAIKERDLSRDLGNNYD